MHLPCTYILASERNGTLYVGVTSDIERRVEAHKSKSIDGFTREYGIDKLVWYEFHDDMRSAIIREKRIKEWQRKWKLRLIEELNPNWDDMSVG